MASNTTAGFGETALTGDTWTLLFEASGGVFGGGVRSINLTSSGDSANAAYVLPVYTDDPGDPTDGDNGSDGAALYAGGSLEIAATNRHGGRVAKVFARSAGATLSHAVTIL